MTSSQGSPIQRAHELGQSFWLDYIRRDLVQNGELERLIARGEIRGVTSNPSIFQQAIGESELYDAAMRPLAHAGWSADRVFEHLAVDDIRAAADLFLPLYEGTGGKDGFVSIEVNPELANETEASLEEARRLWGAVNRPNLMVKIPATPAGVPAIERAISEGININVTLIFDLERYAQVMQAYLRGLERRESEGLAVDRIASVASFFVSRVDSTVDRQLELIVREEGPNAPRAAALLGRAAVANAKLAYAQFKSVFEEPRFARLQQQGARVQRPLWASTSTKNPAYSDVLYVEQLIGPNTVNTLPPKTLEAFRHHGRAELTLERDLSDARAQLQAIESLGVDLRQITLELERDGVRAFADSYTALIEIVERRSAEMRAELGQLQPRLGPLLEQLKEQRVVARFWRADPTLWPKGAERLVLDYPEVWQPLQPQFAGMLEPGRTAETRRIAWLAIGGVRWPLDGDPEQLQLETLDPVEQRVLAAETPIDSTLFIAASTHSEDPAVAAMLEPVWERSRNRLGEAAAQRFLVLAPAESSLARLAQQREIPLLVAELELGGPVLAAELAERTSSELLEGAGQVRERCGPHHRSAENPGLYLGALLALGARAGLRRIGLLADPGGEPAADWLADRIESSGVGARLAVFRELPAETESQDRALIYLRTTGVAEPQIRTAAAAGTPLIVLEADSGLGGEAVRWEMGLGVAAHVLELDPHPASLDRRALGRMSRWLERRRGQGRFPGPKPTVEAEAGAVWWSVSEQPAGDGRSADSFAAALARRLGPGSVLNLAILRRRSHTLDRTLRQLREQLRARAIDLRLRFGSAPRVSGSWANEGWQLGLILCEQPKLDQPVPGYDRSFAELQLGLAQAVYTELLADRLEAGLLVLKPPATANNWLRTLIGALE